mmetsp:Transcript_5932/g.20750  ORF Transcript_5932/g.20750 Transcript_5932/m.20750 type:complete len:248 (+) Transcript_5932:9901-10644(+)
MLVTLRMPLPPPPSLALIIIGKPTSFAFATASSTLCSVAARMSSGASSSPGDLRPDPDHGMTFTPTLCASRLALILSPTASMLCARGPRKVIPTLSRPAGRLGYSDAWPHPGHTASTLHSCAYSTTRSTFAKLFLLEPPGTTTKSSARRKYSALLATSSGVAMATKWRMRLSPNCLNDHSRSARIARTAASPLFAMRMRWITRLPPRDLTHASSTARFSAADMAPRGSRRVGRSRPAAPTGCLQAAL